MKRGFTHESTYNESKEWYTPRTIFEALGVEFDLDPCSPGQDIVPWIPAQIHHTYLDNGLETKWLGKVFMNPPYGMDTPKWMKRLSQHRNGIALVFARPDTKWFHDYIPIADAICFIKGRIGFIPAEKSLLYADGQWKPKGGCGAASMLVAYGNDMAEALFNSGLGITLSVSKNAEKFRTVRDFAGGGRRPVMREAENEIKAPVAERKRLIDENLPRLSENRQGALFGR